MPKAPSHISIMRFLITLISVFSFSFVLAQKHDYIWLFGYSSNLIDSSFGGSIIDFNSSPPDIYYEYRDMDLYPTNASICDTAGSLLFYTNGIYIANSLGFQMENGYGLNPGPYADAHQDNGYILGQGVIILPDPESDSLFFLIHMDLDYPENNLTFHSEHLYYTLIDITGENGLGNVIEKNIEIVNNNLDQGKLTATRHANGRDWWLLIREYGSNNYYKILVRPRNILFEGIQSIGISITSDAIGQAVFSPDGAKYASVHMTGSGSQGDPAYVSIFDFNRCTGELSNPIQFMYVDSATAGGIAFSPNSRFLYVSSRLFLYQYDLWENELASSRITIAQWDGFVENNFFATTFYLAQLGANGKIYINSTNTVSYLHVIEYPDLKGDSCQVCQHCVDLPTKNAFSLPNFPNYRLGPLEGSPCDTLRQPPTAAFGFTAQQLSVTFTDSSYHDIRSWHWDFGDGDTSTLAHPEHEYPAEGQYEVCLTVANPRGADTLCRMVNVMLTGTDSPGAEAFVTLAPNPVRDVLWLSFARPPGPGMTLVLVDGLGRSFSYPLQTSALQSVDLSKLPSGLYGYELSQNGKKVTVGKLVKVW